jgi:hypothetical protein
MKRYFLLGLAAFGLISVTPTESKADDGFRIYVNPGYQQYRPYYYDRDRYYHRWHRYHHRHHYDRDYDRDHDRD